MLVRAPLVEPVSLDEAKAHARIDGDADDAGIASLIVTSRLQIEAALGLALVSQDWRLTLDRWPADGRVAMPVFPVSAVSVVRVASADGPMTNVASADWRLIKGANGTERLEPRDGAAWPLSGLSSGGIEIDFTAGFGAAAHDVPAPIRHALLLLVAHWYENREPNAPSATGMLLPQAVSVLLAPYRRVGL